MNKRCNGVFEGGGVRGIGHIGAGCALDKAGYSFLNVAGSSAGAIVAALIAAGFTADEMKREMLATDYLKFKQKGFLEYFGKVGKGISICLNYGIYSGEYFEKWIEELLLRKGKFTFNDIKPYGSLKMTVTDLTERRLLVFPDDLIHFGIEPKTYPISKAVRMSMSIPLFYEPTCLIDKEGKTHYMVDGGMISNYPIWILDNGHSDNNIPTIGFRFSDEFKDSKKNKKKAGMDIIEYIKLLVSTTFDACDNRFSLGNYGDSERCIIIPTVIDKDGKKKQIFSTDFDIEPTESAELFQNGLRAGEAFLDSWNFEKWKRLYR